MSELPSSKAVFEQHGTEATGMAEYIEREGLINNRPEGRNPKQIGKEEYNKGWNDCRSAFYALIDDMPAEDVAPVRHGRWIFGKDLPCGWGKILKNKYHLYCSECLEQAFNRSEDNDPDFDVETSYCPFCGCCMDGGAD